MTLARALLNVIRYGDKVICMKDSLYHIYVTTHLRHHSSSSPTPVAACGKRTAEWRLVDQKPTCKMCRELEKIKAKLENRLWEIQLQYGAEDKGRKPQ